MNIPSDSIIQREWYQENTCTRRLPGPLVIVVISISSTFCFDLLIILKRVRVRVPYSYTIILPPSRVFLKTNKHKYLMPSSPRARKRLCSDHCVVSRSVQLILHQPSIQHHTMGPSLADWTRIYSSNLEFQEIAWSNFNADDWFNVNVWQSWCDWLKIMLLIHLRYLPYLWPRPRHILVSSPTSIVARQRTYRRSLVIIPNALTSSTDDIFIVAPPFTARCSLW